MRLGIVLRDLLMDALDLRSGFGRRAIRSEPPRRHGVSQVLARRVVLRSEWSPYIDGLQQRPVSFGGHADDDVRCAIESNHLPDNIGIAAIATRPDSAVKNHHGQTLRVFLDSEVATTGRLQAKQPEKARGHLADSECFWTPGRGQRHLRGADRLDLFQRLCLLLQTDHLDRRQVEQGLRRIGIRRARVQPEQTVGFRVGQRPQHHGVGHRDDGRCRRKSYRHRQGRRHRVGTGANQRPGYLTQAHRFTIPFARHTSCDLCERLNQAVDIVCRRIHVC